MNMHTRGAFPGLSDRLRMEAAVRDLFRIRDQAEADALALIAELDAADGDPDLEPDLAGFDRRFADDREDEDDLEPSEDHESSLGSTNNHPEPFPWNTKRHLRSGDGAQEHWGAGQPDEPSLASTNDIDQERWSAGNRNAEADAEDDDSDREPYLAQPPCVGSFVGGDVGIINRWGRWSARPGETPWDQTSWGRCSDGDCEDDPAEAGIGDHDGLNEVLGEIAAAEAFRTEAIRTDPAAGARAMLDDRGISRRRTSFFDYTRLDECRLILVGPPLP